MASSSKPRIQGYKAGGAINPFTFVKFGADSSHVVACGANDRPIGIAQNSAALASGDPVEVALPGGGAKLSIGMTIALAARLYSDTNGKGQKVDGASKLVGAIAMESGVSGDIIGVEVTPATESVATD